MKQNVLLSALIAFVLTFVQLVSPASAKENPVESVSSSNSCQVNIVAKSGVAPFTTTIEVTGIEGPTMVVFGDNSKDKPGRLQKHTYHAVSKFKVTALVDGVDGHFYRCHGYVTSLPNGNMEIPGFENDENDEKGDLPSSRGTSCHHRRYRIV